MLIRFLLGAMIASCAGAAQAEAFKIASPNRGSWEGAIPEMGKQAGIFKKHGLDLDIIYTSGGGETMQVVISGSVDVGLSAGLAGALGAYAKGAPIRIVGASSSGGREVFYYVPAASPLKSLREASGKSIAYSTTGSSTHIGALRWIKEYDLKGAKITPTGDAATTTTQALTGQVDIGWSVGPFNLDRIEKGEIRMIGQLSDSPHMRAQTIRVQIANSAAIAARPDAFRRYLQAYQETLDWMYASPDAVKIYMGIVEFPESSVRRTINEFITKDTLQIDKVLGIPEAMEDAVQFKFIAEPLSEKQLAELIQIDALKK